MSHESRVMSQVSSVLNFEFRNSDLFSVYDLAFGTYDNQREEV